MPLQVANFWDITIMVSFFNLTKATRREAQATRAIYSKWSGLISIERASWLFIVRITRKRFLQENFKIFEKFSKTLKKSMLLSYSTMSSVAVRSSVSAMLSILSNGHGPLWTKSVNFEFESLILIWSKLSVAAPSVKLDSFKWRPEVARIRTFHSG